MELKEEIARIINPDVFKLLGYMETMPYSADGIRRAKQDADDARSKAETIITLMNQQHTAQRIEGALRFYADPISYAVTQAREPRSAVHGDNGRRAKDALACILEVKRK